MHFIDRALIKPACKVLYIHAINRKYQSETSDTQEEDD